MTDEAKPKVIHRRPKRLPRRPGFEDSGPKSRIPEEVKKELTQKEKTKMRSELCGALESLTPVERLAVLFRWIHGTDLSTLEEVTKRFDMDLFQSVSQETIKYLIQELFSVDKLKGFFSVRAPHEKGKKAIEEKARKIVRRGKVRRGKFGNLIGLRVDLGVSCKSSTEANFARILTLQHGRDSWQYEPKRYPVTIKGKRDFYTPDFVRTDENGREHFYEIKMFFPKGFNGKAKLEAFLEQYPSVKFVFVHLSRVEEMALYAEHLVKRFGADRVSTLCIDALNKVYSKLIPEWEGAVK